MKAAKTPSGDLQWLSNPNTDQERRMKAQIANKLVEDLYFDARINKAGDLTMLLHIGDSNSQIVRKFDTDPNHVNPNEMKPIGEPHKHMWRDDYRDNWAYVPDPPIEHGNRNLAVIQFLDECHVATEGIKIIDSGKRAYTQRRFGQTLAHLQFEDEDWEGEDGSPV